jgi:hypothetical protein
MSIKAPALSAAASRKLFGYTFAILTLLITVYGLFISSGCSAPSREAFAIYLTKGDIPPAQMPDGVD